jgi:hypothetical protein
MARTFALRSGKIFAATIIGVAFACLPLAAAAADLRQGGELTIPTGETINDDLYVAGGTITVNGNVNGSVLVAGGTKHHDQRSGGAGCCSVRRYGHDRLPGISRS